MRVDVEFCGICQEIFCCLHAVFKCCWKDRIWCKSVTASTVLSILTVYSLSQTIIIWTVQYIYRDKITVDSFVFILFYVITTQQKYTQQKDRLQSYQ